jgi:glycosyltransferase involved in cell wall biosynthesis
MADRIKFSRTVKAVRNSLAADKIKYDVFVAPVSSNLLAQVKDEIKYPVIFITDATGFFILEMYGKDLDASQLENEAEAMRIASQTIFSSEYMAKRALKEFSQIFEQDTGKLGHIVFGLNMDEIPPANLNKSDFNEIRLLFVGKDWDRKGGVKGLQICKYLFEKGLPVRLTIVGCNPPDAQGLDYVNVIPNINKNDPTEQSYYCELLRRAHFLLLPTLADCTPMVIAEANAFGAPALTTRVGGIASLVTPDQNGMLFNLDDSAEKWGDAIIELVSDRTRYLQMSKQSRLYYERHLNWRAWSNDLISIIKSKILVA